MLRGGPHDSGAALPAAALHRVHHRGDVVHPDHFVQVAAVGAHGVECRLFAVESRVSLSNHLQPLGINLLDCHFVVGQVLVHLPNAVDFVVFRLLRFLCHVFEVVGELHNVLLQRVTLVCIVLCLLFDFTINFIDRITEVLLLLEERLLLLKGLLNFSLEEGFCAAECFQVLISSLHLGVRFF